MRRLVTIIGFVAVFAALALAENFSGKLMDASCDPQKAEACQPSAATTAFAIEHGGKLYKLDEAGNAKAVEAFKNRADRAADPNANGKAAVMAKITGTAEGDTIKVQTLEIQ